ncbi:MAG: hypothetical protein GDA54_05990 [Alphaproteobacteria bacterium GM7ARS4]|nr:hypothetical protein [Alphaproteobacteria bacterium GM7ARS4]
MTTLLPLVMLGGMAALYITAIIYRQTPQEQRLLLFILTPLFGCCVLLYSVIGRPFLPASPHAQHMLEEHTKTTAPTERIEDTMTVEAFRELLRQATQGLPEQTEDPTAWIVVASEWMALEETAQARSILAQGIEYFPDNIDLLSRYALLQQNAQPHHALPLWQRIHAIDPTHAQALWFLALHAQAKEQWTEARAFLTQLLQQLDTNNDTHQELRDTIQQRLAHYPPPPDTMTP